MAQTNENDVGAQLTVKELMAQERGFCDCESCERCASFYRDLVRAVQRETCERAAERIEAYSKPPAWIEVGAALGIANSVRELAAELATEMEGA